MEELKDVIRELLEIKAEFKLKNLDDNTLFDSGVRIFNTLKIKEGKAVGTKEQPYPKKEFNMKDPNSPATEKQIYLLKQMRVECPKDTTKLEASKLIEEAKKKQEEGDF